MLRGEKEKQSHESKRGTTREMEEDLVKKVIIIVL
jgi:hypothetical protein